MQKDILDYAEAQSEKTLIVARKSYDDLHERVYKLATVLTGGAGAIGVYALGKVGSGDALQWVPLATLSAWWFVTAGVLVIRGATSSAVSPGNGPDNIRRYYLARLSEQPADSVDCDAAAMQITREAELDLQQIRIRNYTAGCTARAKAIDAAYKSVAISPTPAALAAIAAYFFRSL